jgi:hypothetical protein
MGRRHAHALMPLNDNEHLDSGRTTVLPPKTNEGCIKRIIIFATSMLCSAFPAVACSFDTDCEVGSKCAKTRGALYGVCVGGLFPGNRYNQVPVYDPLDLDESVGNTCTFDIDCGISNKCVKELGSIDGVCMRTR